MNHAVTQCWQVSRSLKRSKAPQQNYDTNTQNSGIINETYEEMKKRQDQHKRVLDFLNVIRNSFHDTYIVYNFGGCYGLYQILKFVFPDAQPYFDDEEKEHIYTKIGGRYYDIKGEQKNIDKVKKLTEKEKQEWENVAWGQRIEWMVAKYNSGVVRRHKGEV